MRFVILDDGEFYFVFFSFIVVHTLELHQALWCFFPYLLTVISNRNMFQFCFTVLKHHDPCMLMVYVIVLIHVAPQNSQKSKLCFCKSVEHALYEFIFL